MAEQTARMVVDPAFAIAEVDDRVFGSFVEHMGRCVYGGIYEPGHPTADADGFRGDVLELVRELGVTIVRYPGGNFVSGYDWEDGIGPRESRPRALDLAWRSIETNQVGTDDFMGWAAQAGIEPMMAVNMGSRATSTRRARCSSTATPRRGSTWADRRVANGHEDPYGVKVWCIGNEMDGPWQIGHKDAVEYGRQGQRGGQGDAAGRPDRSSSSSAAARTRQMPTFGAWEDTVLDLAWDVADHISLHTYYDPAKFASPEAFLAAPLDLDRMIETVAATADAVAGRKRDRKRVMLSVDEWNVWYQTPREAYERKDEPFVEAPPLIEDTYKVTDALVVGCCLITLLRHADRVKMACLAQLVNVIAPIRTENGGPAWRQTSYFPFQHAARYGRGTVLRVEPDSPTYEVERRGRGPAARGDRRARRRRRPGAVHRQPRHRAAALEADVRGLGSPAVAEHLVLADDDPAGGQHGRRSRPRRPARGRPAPRSATACCTRSCRPRSWNVLRLRRAAVVADWGRAPPLPFDPIAEAERQWDAHFDGAPLASMAPSPR